MKQYLSESSIVWFLCSQFKHTSIIFVTVLGEEILTISQSKEVLMDNIFKTNQQKLDLFVLFAFCLFWITASLLLLHIKGAIKTKTGWAEKTKLSHVWIFSQTSACYSNRHTLLWILIWIGNWWRNNPTLQLYKIWVQKSGNRLAIPKYDG